MTRLSSSFQYQKAVVVTVFVIGVMVLPLHLSPLTEIDLWKPGVAFDVCMDQREIEAIGLRKGLLVEGGSANDHRLLGLLDGFQGRGQVSHHQAVWRAECLIPADDDIGPLRQGLADGLKGLAPHDDGLAQGVLAKPLHIGG